MNTENIYPNIIPENEVLEIVENKIQENTSESRKLFMIDKINQMKEQLKHYEKIRDRWTKVDSTIRITGLSLSFISAVTATILSTGTFVPLVIAPIAGGVLAGTAAFKTALTEIITISVTSKKKKIFRERCNIINDYINKLHFYMEACKEDRIITVIELDGFNKLLKDYENDINHIRSKSNEEFKPNTLLNKKDIKKIEKEVKKEYKILEEQRLKKKLIDSQQLFVA